MNRTWTSCIRSTGYGFYDGSIELGRSDSGPRPSGRYSTSHDKRSSAGLSRMPIAGFTGDVSSNRFCPACYETRPGGEARAKTGTLTGSELIGGAADDSGGSLDLCSREPTAVDALEAQAAWDR